MIYNNYKALNKKKLKLIKEKPKTPDKLNTIKFIQCYLQGVIFFRHAS